MIDTTRKGTRCRATKRIHGHAAMIGATDRGTIVSEVENLGRTLILVKWDSGPTTYVFPDEIEVLEEIPPD